MPNPQKAKVQGLGWLGTTSGVTNVITAPMPPITVSIEKNSPRNALTSCSGRFSVIIVMDLR